MAKLVLLILLGLIAAASCSETGHDDHDVHHAKTTQAAHDDHDHGDEHGHGATTAPAKTGHDAHDHDTVEGMKKHNELVSKTNLDSFGPGGNMTKGDIMKKLGGKKYKAIRELLRAKKAAQKQVRPLGVAGIAPQETKKKGGTGCGAILSRSAAEGVTQCCCARERARTAFLLCR